jgi:outer membrane protein TolC
LDIIRSNILLQQNALDIVRIQKDAAVVTELAVKQFEAQLLKSKGMEFDILQQITENENKINFLLSRYPQKIERDKSTFNTQMPVQVNVGIPAQQLKNRPDIKKAALELMATKFDVKVAQAEFYPSLRISGGLGYQAFKQAYLFSSPQSLAFGLMGDMFGPLINKNAIIAEYNKANAYQIQALYEYQKAILNGFVEVSNEMSNIKNLEKSYNLKAKEVEVLTNSIDIANDLFKAARANYLEVLMTQRDALESKLQLVETKKLQFNAVVNIYRGLGGGWN